MNSVIYGNILYNVNGGRYIGENNLAVANFDNIKVNSASSVKFGSAFEVSLLEVTSDSSVSIADGSQFKELNIIFEEDFGTGDTISNFSLSDIFGDTSTIVESALQSHETSLFVTNSSGEEFNASFNEGGQISVGAAVPEASTYATILGFMALAIALRRKKR